MASPATIKGRPSKVLIVLGSPGIGDAVEAFPVFEIVREHWPDVYLVAASFNKSQSAMLEMSPHLSARTMLVEHRGIKRGWRAIKGCGPNFKAMQGFDIILFLYKKVITLTMVLTARLTGANVVYKHDYHYRDTRQDPYSDFPEHVFFQIVATRLLGLPLARLREPRLSLSVQDQQFGEEFCKSRGLGHRPLVMLNTQSYALCRGWGIERYACLANALVESGADVLINGWADSQVAEFRSVAHKLKSGVFLAENRSPRELAAVVGKCDLHIGDPSGPASLAMAMGIPTIILQGPGEHEYPGQDRPGPLWWPRGPKYEVLSKIDWCQLTMGGACRCWEPETRRHLMKSVMNPLGLWDPWRTARKHVMKALGMSRHGSAIAAGGYPCLEAITVEAVVAAARRQLCRASRQVNAS